MKTVIPSLDMFLFFLIINISINNISSLKSTIKNQSQFETLKGKLKEKILSSKGSFPKGLNDTEIIKILEDKVMECAYVQQGCIVVASWLY